MTRFAFHLRWLFQLAGLWLIQARSLFAHDCSGPGDCQAVPDNIAKTTTVVTALVTATLANRVLRNGKKKTEPPADEWGLDEKEPEIDYEKLYGEELGVEPPAAPAEPAPPAEPRRPLGPPDRPLGE